MRGSTRGTGRQPGRALAIVGAAALTLALAACDPGEPTEPDTGANGPSQTTTEPETSEPSTTDAPTPPDLDQPVPPEAMGVDDREGAAATAEYFFSVLDYARATGDSRQLQAISTPGCEFCTTMLDTVAAMSDDGGWIESSGPALLEVRVQYLDADDEADYLVRFVLELPERTAHLADGTTQTIPAETHPRVALGAVWTADGFVVDGVDIDTDG